MRPGHEINNILGEFFPPILLEEMSPAFNDNVQLILRPRNQFLEYLFTAAGNRIAVAEHGDKRFFKS